MLRSYALVPTLELRRVVSRQQTATPKPLPINGWIACSESTLQPPKNRYKSILLPIMKSTQNIQAIIKNLL